MSILLPEPERKHLLNLLAHDTRGYRGGYFMRTELSHLKSLDLIRAGSGIAIDGLRSNMTFDLADHVQLTEVGMKAARMVRSGIQAAGEAELES